MSTMDRETLLERLRGIEWDDFEVKAAAGGVPKTAYTTVSAFANTSGGWIVFGVKEAKPGFEVIGVSDPDTMQNEFVGACRSMEKFTRPVDLRPHCFEIDGKQVLAFYVSPSPRFDKPIRVRVDKAWFAYIRVASGDQRCTPEEEARFLRDASAETFDIQLMPDARLDDLDAASLRWVRGIYRDRHPTRPLTELEDLDFLDELGLMREGKLTHAAILLFGNERLVTRLKPGGVVDFRQVRERWSEELPASRFDDRVLCDANIIQALRTLIERFLRLVPNPFELDPNTLQRRAHPPEYPALREALVNLLMHQDYSDQHRTARVLWYEDRTIFDNPGDSFVSIAEMLDGGASDLRNPRIARLMRQIGFAEQAGTGVPTIVRTWRRVERTPPVVVNDPGRKIYQLTLSWDPVPKREDAFWKARFGASVAPDEARVLAWLRRVGVADRALARMATGASARETRQMVEHLIVNCLVEPVDDSPTHIRMAAHIAEILESMGSELENAAEQATGQVTEQVTGQVTEQVTGQVTEQVMQLLRVLDGAMSRSELQAALSLTHRAHFTQSYLSPALEARLVEMTIPDKPTSSRQKYQITDAGRALLASRPGENS